MLRARHSGQRSRRSRIAILIGAGVLGVTGISYLRALTYPGSAGWQQRSVDWVRGHGGSGLVDTLENWRYADPPPRDGSAGSAVPKDPGPSITASAAQIALGEAPAPLLPPETLPPFPGEGLWHGTGWATHGAPLVATTFLRTDPAHPTVAIGYAWLRQPGLTLQLHGGTREPVAGASWPDRARIPPEARGRLVATFNSGWLMSGSQGGWYGEGRLAHPLRAGAASLVIDTSGDATVTSWSGGPTPPPGVTAVRQNLDLILENGQPVAGLASHTSGNWGNAHNQLQYTQRSGIGVDRHGNLIYVAGAPINLAGLATAMVRADVVTGMELDIHTGIGFNAFPRQPGSRPATPVKLMPSMSSPADRYLAADQRDFFTVSIADGRAISTARLGTLLRPS